MALSVTNRRWLMLSLSVLVPVVAVIISEPLGGTFNNVSVAQIDRQKPYDQSRIPSQFRNLTAANGTINQSLLNQTQLCPSSEEILQPRGSSNNTFNRFNYYIPYGISQPCDIYGPTCQTGIITIGSSKECTPSFTTTLQCSSYLRSQREYLQSVTDLFDPAWKNTWKWINNFGRSPECRSFASIWQEGGTYSFTGCQAAEAHLQATASYQSPLAEALPLLYNKAAAYYDWPPEDLLICCGRCNVETPRVRLLYFPDEDAKSHCEANGRRIGYVGPANQSVRIDDGQLEAVSAETLTSKISGSIAHFDSLTLTSPSVYIQILGAVTVADVCGQIGPIMTSPILSMLPEELSTFVLTPGVAITNMIREVSSSRSLTIADLECPSLGVHEYQSGELGRAMSVGSPWLPLLVAPSQILSMRPEWLETCRGLRTDGLPRGIGLIDPPRALTRVSDLVSPADRINSEQTAAVTSQYSEPSDPPRPGSNVRPVMPLQTFRASNDGLPKGDMRGLGDPTPEQDSSEGNEGERTWVKEPSTFQGDVNPIATLIADPVDSKENADKFHEALGVQIPDDGDLSTGTVKDNHEGSDQQYQKPASSSGNNSGDPSQTDIGFEIPVESDGSDATQEKSRSSANGASTGGAAITGDDPVKDNLQKFHDALGFGSPQVEKFDESEHNTSDETKKEDLEIGVQGSQNLGDIIIAPSTTNDSPPLSGGTVVPVTTGIWSALTEPATTANGTENQQSDASGGSNYDAPIEIYTGQSNSGSFRLLKDIRPLIIIVWVSLAIFSFS